MNNSIHQEEACNFHWKVTLENHLQSHRHLKEGWKTLSSSKSSNIEDDLVRQHGNMNRHQQSKFYKAMLYATPYPSIKDTFPLKSANK